MKLLKIFTFIYILLFIASACKDNDDDNIVEPQVYTIEPVNITDNKAVLRANCILDKKKFELVFEWKKVSDSILHTAIQQAIHGICSFPVDNLEEDTEYTVRALMIDMDSDTLYGKEIGFRTHGTMQDIDGNTYLTMRYGKSVWMTENLRVTRYSDGMPIEARTGGINEDEDGPVYYQSLNHTPYYTNPNFGLLYNWAAAVRAEDCKSEIYIPLTENVQGVCPEGWHLSSQGEWFAMTFLYGGFEEAAASMKTENWITEPIYTVNNYSQFSVEPAGFYYYEASSNGSFNGVYKNAFFWTKDQVYDIHRVSAFAYVILPENPNVTRINMRKCAGYSVRCVKD